jgi:hypothetical protein
MIKFENTETCGIRHAIRGMRNAMNSWDKSDSYIDERYNTVHIGENDKSLMQRLFNAGTDHRKYLRMITVYADITAPLYWWKEYDTYKVGTTANSCSTMHKIHAKKFTLSDFSREHLTTRAYDILLRNINFLNECRNLYINYETDDNDGFPKPTKKEVWWQMIQLLPTSYNQKRTVMLNYEVLANIYKSRQGHKLKEWHDFIEWIERLPYTDIFK